MTQMTPPIDTAVSGASAHQLERVLSASVTIPLRSQPGPNKQSEVDPEHLGLPIADGLSRDNDTFGTVVY